MIGRRRLLAASSAIAAAHFSRKAISAERIYRVGLINKVQAVSKSSPFWRALLDAFAKQGYNHDDNLMIVTRGAEGDFSKFPSLFADLEANKVEVIIALSFPAALSARSATKLPVVVFNAGDPVETGLVASLARPDGHLTGISDLTAELSPKRLQLMKEIIPNLRRVAMVWNAGDAGMALRYQQSSAAARLLGLTVEPYGVREGKDFEPMFIALSGSRPDAIFVVADGLTVGNRKALLGFAEKNGIAAVYEDSELVVRDGALMFYGPDPEESVDRLVSLVDRIFKGANPKELPFEQPSRFRFILNLKTARALGLSVPPALLLSADEVIE